MKKYRYRVVIPYYYEFYVEAAENKNDAIEQAHNQTGNITGYDDKKAYVEKLEAKEE